MRLDISALFLMSPVFVSDFEMKDFQLISTIFGGANLFLSNDIFGLLSSSVTDIFSLIFRYAESTTQNVELQTPKKRQFPLYGKVRFFFPCFLLTRSLAHSLTRSFPQHFLSSTF
jgi:hypothetical protein